MLGTPLFKKWNTLVPSGIRSLYTASVLEAARRGTRMRADAKKKAAKKEVVKKVYIPLRKRLEMIKMGTISPRKDDSNRGYPVDDVFFRGHYRWVIYSIAEALQMHRETQHPTQYNHPAADVIANIELSMSTKKKNRYIDGFSNIILLPHPFEVAHNRTILTICKDEEMVERMKQMEVTESVGPEAIKLAEKGLIDFAAYDHVICHTSLLPNLINLRVALKKKFPSPKDGTAAMDLAPMTTRLLKGIKYEAVKDKYDHDFAKVEVKIGSLDNEPEQIEENLKTLVIDVENSKPKARSARCITLVNLYCANSREMFKIDHTQYLPPEDDVVSLKDTLKAQSPIV